MEKFFEVSKDSEFYKKYFDFIELSNKVNEAFKKFAEKHGIETTSYYQNTKRLCIIPTDADKKKFSGMFMKNSDTDFKSTSTICKEWVSLCKELNLTSPRKPSLAWDSDCRLNSYSTRSRLFHIEDRVYGSIDNNNDSEIILTDEFIEMKASEFWKMIEDIEEKQK